MLAFCVTFSQELSAQGLNSLNPFDTFKAPQTHDLGAVAFSPVSMYTGKPSIEIPIYTLTSFNLKVPISLSYDASGFVPNKAPGVVGLNWTLVAGGMVTRIVNTVPDESNDGGPVTSGSAPGKSHGFFRAPHTLTNAQVSEMSNITDDVYGYYKFFYELSPDLFVFNFCGHTGKFMMGQDGKFKIEGDQEYKIDVDSIGTFSNGQFAPGNYRSKIKITDEDGVKYEFGGSNASIEYSAASATASFETSAPNAWYLTRITAPEGNAVNFYYAEDNDLRATNSNYTIVRSNTAQVPQIVKNVYLRYIRAVSNSGRELQRVNLINSAAETFGTYQNEQLDEIQVKDSIDIKKTFKFTYTPYSFYEPSVGPGSRNFLASFGETGLPPYTFDYYNTSQLSTGQAENKTDYWGYYNNNNTKPNAQSAYTYDSEMNMISDFPGWAPNLEFTKTGILQFINHPLKGKTQYFYEAQSYGYDYQLSFAGGWMKTPTSGAAGASGIAGGLRIAKISLIDGSTVINKEYKYVSGYTPTATTGLVSSGIITRRPTKFRIGLSPQPDATSIGEVPINYEEVVELSPGNGYTIHKFTSGTNYPDRVYMDGTTPYVLKYANNGSPIYSDYYVVNFYNKRSSAALERGKLQSQIFYTQTGVPVSGTTYTYNTDLSRYNKNITTVEFPYKGAFPQDLLGDGINNLITTFDTYFFSTKLKKEVYTQYNGSLTNVASSSSTSYNYNDKQQLIEKIVSLSDGTNRVEKYRHVADYSYIGTSNLVLKQMYDRNIFSPIVEEQVLKRTGSSSVLLSGKQTTYRKLGVNNFIFRPYETRLLAITSPSSDTTLSRVNNGNLLFHPGYDDLPRMMYNQYDSQGNLQQAGRPQGTPQTRIWGYKQQYPIADVINAVTEANSTSSDVFNQELVIPVNTVSKSVTFTSAGGSISLTISANPGQTYRLRYSLGGPSFLRTGVLCDAHSEVTCEGYPGSVSYNNLLPGSYTLTISTDNPDALYKSFFYSYTGTTTTTSANEIYQENFEEGSSFSSILTRVSASITDKVHTGKFSGKITASGASELVSLSKLTFIPVGNLRRYRYSGWVYSTGPQTELFLFMKRQNETGYYSYVDSKVSNVINRWVYIEKEIDVPADVANLAIRVDNNGNGTAWYDDLRIIPADAQMTTYTYDPLVGVTSQTDAKGMTIYYEYDELERLKVIKDQNGNIVKTYQYNYKP
jgi:YD repeat-containing protein